VNFFRVAEFPKVENPRTFKRLIVMAEKRGAGHFTPAEVGAKFQFELLDRGEVCRWFVTRLHPQGFQCPNCSRDLTDSARRLEKWESLEQVRCPHCLTKFTAKTGTLLEGCKLEPREVFLLANYLDLEVPPRRIAERLRVDIGTVRSWQQKFQALAEVVGA
jgi:transposase-like protein